MGARGLADTGESEEDLLTMSQSLQAEIDTLERQVETLDMTTATLQDAISHTGEKQREIASLKKEQETLRIEANKKIDDANERILALRQGRDEVQETSRKLAEESTTLKDEINSTQQAIRK